jgi:hypothetical protein
MTKDAAQHRSWTFYETTNLKKRHKELAVLLKALPKDQLEGLLQIGGIEGFSNALSS